MDDSNDFELVWRGYHPGQVQQFIDDLTHRLDAALSGLEAAATLDRQLAEAHLEIERLRTIRRQVPTPQETEERLERIFSLAEEQAEELRAVARTEADGIRARALAQATRARREFEAALRDRRDREQPRDELLEASSEPDQPPASGRRATRATG